MKEVHFLGRPITREFAGKVFDSINAVMDFEEHHLRQEEATGLWVCACGTGPWTFMHSFLGHVQWVHLTKAPA